MNHYGEQAITRITDTYSGEQAIVTSDAQLRQALEGWEDMSEPGVAEAIDALIGYGTRAADVIDLGVQVDELDPDDRDEVPDDLWAEWMCQGWLSDGRVWDDGRVVVSDCRPPMRIGDGWEWSGGPVSVRSYHGDQERRWRHVRSLADLRDAVEVAHAEEQAWQDEQDRKAEAHSAGLDPLRRAQEELERAQQVAEERLRARDDLIRALIAQGYTGGELSRALPISAKQVSIIRNR